MNIITTGSLYKLFKEKDCKTIIRMKNLRKLVKDNNVKYHQVGEIYLIDYDNFFEIVNPKHIKKEYEIPKIRSIKSATREYNKTHTKKISYHVVERCIASGNVPYIKTVRYYLINYTELEKEIDKTLKKVH